MDSDAKLTYRKRHKGSILVLVAFAIFGLIAMAALVIDFGFFYSTKSQLQNAADSSALAGVALLDGTNSTDQTAARNEAYKFALSNKAAGDAVTLDKNQTNDINGDILVGYWGSTSTNPNNDFYPNLSNPTIPTGKTLNAVKVIALRTSAKGNPVNTILGKILSIANVDIATQAIAVKGKKPVSFIDVCFTGATPLGSIDVSGIVTFGTPRILETGPSATGLSSFAWTTYFNSVSSTNELSNLICGKTISDPPDLFGLIGQSPGVYSTMGTTSVVDDFALLMYSPLFDSANKQLDSNGKVTGWWILIPVIGDSTNPACPPGTQPTPQIVTDLALTHVTAICGAGANKGCKIDYSMPAGACSSYSNNRIIIDFIASPPPNNSPLVKDIWLVK